MFVYTKRSTSSRSMLVTCLVIGSFFISSAFAMVKIDHKSVKKAPSGQRIDLSAKFNDKSVGISKAFAYFNSDQDSLWHSVPMVGAGGKYSGQLPAPDMYTNTVYYRFLVVNKKDQIRAGEVYTIKIIKDEKALARLQRKPPTDIKIDVSEIQDAQDMVKKVERSRVTQADKDKEAKRSTRPNPGSRVQVLSEYRPDIDTLKGFNDYVNMYYVPKGYGVTAGIVDASASVTGSGVGTYVGPAVAGGGVSTGVLLGGAVLAGGAVVAGGAGGSGGNGGSGAGGGSGGGGPTGSICSNANASGSNVPQSISVDLGKTSGTFGFSWEMINIKDRMVLTTSTLTPLFDTGCVSGNGSVSIPFTDSSGKIRVTVQPNCEGGTSTRWSFTVRCP